ncbi:hypothetical protein RFI_27512, partial [Reticulomyxa filosa]
KVIIQSRVNCIHIKTTYNMQIKHFVCYFFLFQHFAKKKKEMFYVMNKLIIEIQKWSKSLIVNQFNEVCFYYYLIIIVLYFNVCLKNKKSIFPLKLLLLNEQVILSSSKKKSYFYFFLKTDSFYLMRLLNKKTIFKITIEIMFFYKIMNKYIIFKIILNFFAVITTIKYEKGASKSVNERDKSFLQRIYLACTITIRLQTQLCSFFNRVYITQLTQLKKKNEYFYKNFFNFIFSFTHSCCDKLTY